MSYKDQITQFSNSITNFDEQEQSYKKIIDEKSLERFEIYKKNYLHLIFRLFSSDFPALKKYLGENNFYFFAREYLRDKGLSSPSIFEASKQFVDYMIGKYHIHNDDLIEDIIKVDLMWSQGCPQETEVSSGILEYWQELMFGKESNKEINLSKLVKLSLINYKGEQAFKVLNN